MLCLNFEKCITVENTLLLVPFKIFPLATEHTYSMDFAKSQKSHGARFGK